VGIETVDGYLLGDGVAKADALRALLTDRSQAPAAAPFYRALEAVGVRAADEAFVAVRLIVAGRPADDDRVRRLRALSTLVRACVKGDRAALDAALARDAAVLADVKAAGTADLDVLGAAARAAYARELDPAGDGPR
jgi:hypothetical protein